MAGYVGGWAIQHGRSIPLRVIGGSTGGNTMMLEHMGIRWGYVFLRTASHISAEETQELMVQAVEMYLMGEDERDLQSSSYEGKLYTQRRYEVLGSFGGQRFG